MIKYLPGLIALLFLIALWAFSWSQNFLDSHAQHLKGDDDEKT